MCTLRRLHTDPRKITSYVVQVLGPDVDPDNNIQTPILFTATNIKSGI